MAQRLSPVSEAGTASKGVVRNVEIPAGDGGITFISRCGGGTGGGTSAVAEIPRWRTQGVGQGRTRGPGLKDASLELAWVRSWGAEWARPLSVAAGL